jgi:glycerophosphoryl diester phosphodiesterase
VFHDADARRLCGSDLVIGRSTLDQVAALKIGDKPVPTLVQLLDLVAGRVPLLLEIKVDGDLWRWTRALSEALAGYDGRYGLMSFHPGMMRKIRTQATEVRRGLVIAADLPAWRRRLSLWLAGADFVAVDRVALGQPWVNRLRSRMPVYSWTIATQDQRVQARVHADALIWEADGRP